MPALRPTLALASVLALASLFALPAPAPAQAAEQYVVAIDGSGDFTTISGAIEAASDGDEIVLAPGEYVESFIIGKAITLSAAGAARDVVIAADSLEAFRREDALGSRILAGIVVEGDVTIENLSIRDDDGVNAGILLVGGTPTVRDITTDAIVGVNGTTLATIEDSVVDRVNLVGPDVRGTVRGNTIGHGVWVDAGATGTVEDNLILREPIHLGADSRLEAIGNTIRPDEGVPAIWVDWANASVVLIDNVIEGASPGIFVQHGSSALIEGNTISDSVEGIVVVETDAIIRGNTVTNAEDAGIVVEGTGMTAEDNTVQGARVGIVAGVPNGYPPNAPRFDEPSRIIGNTVTDASHFGLLVFDSSPVVSGNSICAGREPIRLEDGASPELGGNEICEMAE